MHMRFVLGSNVYYAYALHVFSHICSAHVLHVKALKKSNHRHHHYLYFAFAVSHLSCVPLQVNERFALVCAKMNRFSISYRFLGHCCDGGSFDGSGRDGSNRVAVVVEGIFAVVYHHCYHHHHHLYYFFSSGRWW